MALSCSVLRAFLLALTLASLHLSACNLLKGSVSCLDCHLRYDLSGITVAIECEHNKLQETTLTNDKGYFEAKISSSSPNCFARLVGGPEQLCSYKKSMVSRIVKAKGSEYTYTLSAPLSFLSSCPSKKSLIGSSKTVDLPLPKEWGLAPTSYYVPFFPIIGIP
ncbi:uncharacterized protein A4U43_C04F7120 [Asparagus officinalis]|uniref:Pollen Ole e 1 allergen and extensin family protein n=1 Tax=Asparagus officinalis TaxID=4686 RepID=A0A5P1F1L9_ASPOF|nr:uncharacterized protein LOC109836790 [Asparagus officinalis]ONK71307.1 uncharacterized protein A4U43_C04F7120 [Asparagus officinalis]